MHSSIVAQEVEPCPLYTGHWDMVKIDVEGAELDVLKQLRISFDWAYIECHGSAGKITEDFPLHETTVFDTAFGVKNVLFHKK